MEITVVRGRSDTRSYHQVLSAAAEADHEDLPAEPVEELLGGLDEVRAAERVVRLLGRTGTAPVGAVELTLPLLDNTGSALLDLQVHPGHRRRGHGRALAAAALALVREAGRSTVVAEVASPLHAAAPGPGPAFAAALGARPVLEDVRRVLDLATLPPARLAGLREQVRSRSAGYRVVQWLGPAPEELVGDLARLAARMSTDPPMGELSWQPERWDGARWREKEVTTVARRRLRLVSAAQRMATGQVVAYTDIGVSELRPERAYQWDTIVDEQHRGHRLGLLLKVANLQLLRERVPAARTVSTWNAADNTHMVAVNDVLGFAPVERWTEWQLELPQPAVAR